MVQSAGTTAAVLTIILSDLPRYCRLDETDANLKYGLVSLEKWMTLRRIFGPHLERVLAQILWIWPNACQRWLMILGTDGDLVIVYWFLKEIFIFFFLAGVHMKVKTYGPLLSSTPAAGRDSLTCLRTLHCGGCSESMDALWNSMM